MSVKQNIKNLSQDDLFEFIKNHKQPAYRAEQIRLALYKQKIEDFDEISNIPKSFREELQNNFDIFSIKIKTVRESSDGSVKFLFDLNDNNSIEAVYMPWYDNEDEKLERQTLCISTMAGCSVDCAFCATGKLGFKRNLESSEIIDQIILVEKYLRTKITNIVYMGMGEPFLNYSNTIKSLEILTDPNFELFSRKKITVSTSGIAPRITQFATSPRPVKLAISLHATDDKTRDYLIPMNKTFNLEVLMNSVEDYYKATKIPITYEYILFKDLNDTKEDIKRLTKIARRVPSRVNLIPFNDISFTNPIGPANTLKSANRQEMEVFAEELRKNQIPAIIRETFGGDIEAACGQLALSEEVKKVYNFS